ncbi:MAG: DUF4869 domain-containing protein [Alphaproteobacteria bacterium]|nr:DUF4869 domain-containing protein [Alphaproteobacteria bacterium]
MLKVFFGLDKESILDIDIYFNNVYELEWFNDEFVKSMVRDVDKSEVISPSCIQSPVLGQITPESLSGGVKALICLWKLDDFKVDLIVCGENCERWIKEISDLKDINVSMSGYDLLFEKSNLNGICLNNNQKIYSGKEWCKYAADFVEVCEC